MRYKSPIFDPANAGLDLLSRINLHSSHHDTGFVSAFRPEYDEAQNEQRERWLKAFLIEKGYFLIAVKGSIHSVYSRTDQHWFVKQFYFVTEYGHAKRLKDSLSAMGAEFGQEQILFKRRKEKNFNLISTRGDLSVEAGKQTCQICVEDGEPTGTNKTRLQLTGSLLSVAYAGNNWTRYIASVQTGIAHP